MNCVFRLFVKWMLLGVVAYFAYHAFMCGLWSTLLRMFEFGLTFSQGFLAARVDRVKMPSVDDYQPHVITSRS